MTYPGLYPPHLGVYHYMRGLPPNPPTLRLMPQDLQCEAEGSQRGTGGVRWCYDQPTHQHSLAKRLFYRNFQSLTAGVVLCYGALQHQVGSCTHIPSWPTITTCIMGQQGAGLGIS